MVDDERKVAVRVVSRIGELDAAVWDACAGSADPFTSYAFLHALEESGSAVAKRGWLPQHLAVEDDDGGVLAVAPLYVKGHSYGEYVFDWSWASAYERAGLSYYPKLQCCVPFTPVTGARLLVPEGGDREVLRRALLGAMLELGRQHDVSSVHVTFANEDEYALAGELGMLQRQGIQYHWHNRDYGCYDDFLGQLIARKRKALRKERRKARSHPITLRTLRGDDIRPHHWDAFYEFYLGTIDKKWSSAYLTREFFEIIGATMSDQAVLFVAEQDGEPVAGALNFIGSEGLFGRYWGSSADYDFLHFELCYHRAIDLAIELGLKRVEAGAQGQHKLQRGYVGSPTYSAHWLGHPEFRRAVAEFLTRERDGIQAELQHLKAASPYSSDRAAVREELSGCD